MLLETDRETERARKIDRETEREREVRKGEKKDDDKGGASETMNAK